MKNDVLNSKLDALLKKIDPDERLEPWDALLKLMEAIDELLGSEPKEELWGKVVRAATIGPTGKKQRRYWERAVQQAAPVLAKEGIELTKKEKRELLSDIRAAVKSGRLRIEK